MREGGVAATPPQGKECREPWKLESLEDPPLETWREAVPSVP